MSTTNSTKYNSESDSMPQAHALCRMLSRIRPRHITVLAYHRIAPDDLENAPGTQLGFSAFESNFRKHLQLLKNSTNVIPASQLAGWLRGDNSLPPNASIITFDDGYRDNLTHALPILQEYNLPAIIYLSTGHMGSQTPLYWNLANYGFRHASLGNYTLPITGEADLNSGTIKQIARRWTAAAKHLPPDQRNKATNDLIKALNVTVDPDAFKNLYLSWDEVRSMQSAGIEFGAHTVSHPILSTVPDNLAQDEIINSKHKIEHELGKTVTSFAYPNGLPGDYTDQHIDILRNAGFDMSFTLSPGPTTRDAARNNPYKIARIYVGLKDSPMRFAMKLWGAAKTRQLGSKPI